MQTYTIFWLTGKSEIIKGNDIADAFLHAGYGGGAIRAVDFYDTGDKREEWVWIKNQGWKKKGMIPHCVCGHPIEVDEVQHGGSYLGFCPSCDITPPDDNDLPDDVAPPIPPKVYINHCHECKGPIDSRYCDRSAIANRGYHCPNPKCGVDLAGKRKEFYHAVL